MIDIKTKFEPVYNRLFPEFREKCYEYLKATLSAIIVEGDMDIIVTLISEIWGDWYMRSKTLPWMINIDRCPDEYLPALSSLIGYNYLNTLNADRQRESIKLFCMIRKWRGTQFGLKNLVRAFGQDSKLYYSNSNLSGIEIIEYGSKGAETVEPNMHPGDIKIRIPELSKILRDSIFDTKLAGTRLIFEYVIFLGIFHLPMGADFYYRLKTWLQFLTQGYDPRIDTYGVSQLETKINQVINNQLTHPSIRGKLIASCQILTYYKDPWNSGFIFNTPGLTNYRGFIEEIGSIEEDYILYDKSF